MCTKKLLALIIFCLVWQVNLFGAEIAWSGSPTTIPADGNIYYINTSMGMPNNVTVNGMLELRTDVTVTNSYTLNVNGTLNIYSNAQLINGSSEDEDSGTINVNYLGAIFLFDATLSNAYEEITNVININSGGALFNYYGDVITDDPDTVGDNTNLNLKAGGKYHNVRGNFPDLNFITFFSGCEFIDSSEITLDRNIQINWTWTITEQVTINGNGHEITFGSNGEIVLEAAKSASLTLNDVILNDLFNDKIKCEDSTGTISINNVTWNQIDDFTFANGTLNVFGNWMIQSSVGTLFTYQSPEIITVAKNATVTLKNTVFRYNSSSANNLLNLFDETSTIHLDRGAIQAKEDLVIDKGTLQTSGASTLEAESVKKLIVEEAVEKRIQGSVTRIGDVEMQA